MESLIIKVTEYNDLVNIRDLWNDKEVMKHVGFPQGLNITLDELIQWLTKVKENPKREHFSIYHMDFGFCGETHFRVDEHGYGAMDIKLLPVARGRNIAYLALSYAIEQAFLKGQAEIVYVDPHPDNYKAWKLYEKLGFEIADVPDHLDVGSTFQILRREAWLDRSR